MSFHKISLNHLKRDLIIVQYVVVFVRFPKRSSFSLSFID